MNNTDSGTYVCNAINSVGKVSKNFIVEMVEYPSILFDFEDPITLSSNEIHNQTCYAQGIPAPSVYWLYDGKRTQEGDTITLNSKMKPGNYTCVAENTEGKIEQSFILKINTKPTMLPSFDVTDREKEIREGSNLKLICPFENYDSIEWERNGILLKGQTNNELLEKGIHRRSQGEYKCTAINPFGTQDFSYQVDILTPPTIAVFDKLKRKIVHKTIDFEEIALKRGENLELKCEALGNPLPNIQWTKDNNNTGDGNIFKIKNISFADAGTYVCVAENSQATAEKHFRVEVNLAPYIEDGIKHVNIEQALGESVELHCNVVGSPQPFFFWFLNE